MPNRLAAIIQQDFQARVYEMFIFGLSFRRSSPSERRCAAAEDAVGDDDLPLVERGARACLLAEAAQNLGELLLRGGLKHVPAKWNPVRNGEPLFADKDMRQP